LVEALEDLRLELVAGLAESLRGDHLGLDRGLIDYALELIELGLQGGARLIQQEQDSASQGRTHVTDRLERKTSPDNGQITAYTAHFGIGIRILSEGGREAGQMILRFIYRKDRPLLADSRLSRRGLGSVAVGRDSPLPARGKPQSLFHPWQPRLPESELGQFSP
jgi:hypothetical protein